MYNEQETLHVKSYLIKYMYFKKTSILIESVVFVIILKFIVNMTNFIHICSLVSGKERSFIDGQTSRIFFFKRHAILPIYSYFP